MKQFLRTAISVLALSLAWSLAAIASPDTLRVLSNVLENKITMKKILAAVLFTVMLASCAKKEPVILLRSGWQVENIGDIAHTPGFIALAEKYIPEAKVVFWPFYGLVPEEEVEMLKNRFPKLEIVIGEIDENGQPTTPELRQAFGKADIFVHNSAPATLAWREALAFKELTGRPFGVYGVTYGLYGIPEKDALSEAAFLYFRDTVSLEKAKADGVRAPIMGFAPDAAFATDVEDSDKAEARAFVQERQKETMAVVKEAMLSKVTGAIEMSKDVLMDKIKGGWAGQTIGCQYGGPTEFKWKGTLIQDYVPIRWDKGNIRNQILHGAGLFDDIYMDLTFVEVFDRLGLDAPADSFAMAFANAGYDLWHANQAGRYNILHGIMPPESGHWLNNPHADDLDYQIESDYAGLMSPGMPNAASAISDKIGHIMNYGDGWYGGIYVGALYALAFVEKDIEAVVKKAVLTVPEGSRFRSCMDDVIRWHAKYPGDWKQTWFECQKKWAEDIGCPDCVLQPSNIDAVINSAYITIGLLYGAGDFFRTMDISTRCGQDSDCNPSSACGILGTLLGYGNIPEEYLSHLQEAEDIKFPYTHSSLEEAYGMSFRHALDNIRANGGEVLGDKVLIKVQKPEPVRLEQGFTDMVPFRRMLVNKFADPTAGFSFEGNGFALSGSINKIEDKSYSAKVLVEIDGEPYRTMDLPVDFKTRSQELCWAYRLPQGPHQVKLTWLNPVEGGNLHCNFAILYRNK